MWELKVLVVEDNEINQQVAQEILAGAGLMVTVCNNGREAVDAVKAKRYDAVLMDVQMPVMDGYTATKAIRKREGERLKAEIELRGQKSEDRDQKSDDRRQKTEGRGLTTENREQETVDRKQKIEKITNKTEYNNQTLSLYP